MKKVRSDDRIGHSRFIFQAEKHKTFCGSRTLAHDDATSDAQTLAAGNIVKFTGPANPHGIEPLTSVRHGMQSNGEPGAMEIGNQALFMVHGLERRRRIRLGQLFQQWSGTAHRAFHLPESVPAVELRVPSTGYRVRALCRLTGHWPLTTSHCVQRSDFRQCSEFILPQFWNASRQIVNRSKRSKRALAHQRLPSLLTQPTNVTQS